MRTKALQLLLRSAAGTQSVARQGLVGLLNTDVALSRTLLESPAVVASASFPSQSQRSIWTSPVAHAEPLSAAATVEGDVSKLLLAVDAMLSADALTAQQVADAAVTLTYLQVKGNRRIWGKVFEKAAAVQGTFDAASLANFLWAASTAEVGHFKTIFELYAPATGLIPSFSPTQLSIVVEGLGKSGAPDLHFFSEVAKTATPKLNQFKAAELTRILYGFASAGVSDLAFTKAVTAALVAKASEVGPREASQALWALAKLRRADTAAITALLKAVKGKPYDSPVDAAAGLWACAFLGASPDAESVKAAAAALKAGASTLKTEHAIQAAWALANLGGEVDTLSTLYGVISAAVDAAPDAYDVHALALLSEALTIAPADAKALKPAVAEYAHKVYSLVNEAMLEKQPQAMTEFKADLAQATAWAAGARYRPQLATAVQNLPGKADHVAVDISVDISGTKVAVVAVGPHYLSSVSPVTPLGPALSHKRVLEAKKYKVVLVPFTTWATLPDMKAKALFLLNAAKSVVPSAAKIPEWIKAAEKPFDPFA